jgi:uncharacterized protein (TIGR03435 family)
MAGSRQTGLSGGGTGMPLAMLGKMVLEKVYGQTIINETGLEGRYDFDLTVTSNSPEAYTVALRDQLGVDVHKARRPMDYVVIDRAIRPEADAGK